MISAIRWNRRCYFQPEPEGNSLLCHPTYQRISADSDCLDVQKVYL